MLNIIAIMGRIVRDPELKKTTTGLSVSQFTIAYERSYAKPGEERQADFVDVVAWRGTAEFVCKYFRKGQLVAVNGSLQARTYEDKEGKKRKVYEILADNVHFADTKSSSGGGGGGQTSAPSRETTSEPVAYSAGAPDDFAVIDDDEDLPF